MSVLLSLVLSTATAAAGQFEEYTYIEPAHEFLYDTRTGRSLTLAEAAAEIQPGEVVVLGEEHATSESENDLDSRIHHDNQLRWLLSRPMRLGMEFLEYQNQIHVDAYISGQKSEKDFLAAVNWGANPFAPYGRLMRATRANGTVALNIPRAVSRQVSRGGPDSLTSEQRNWLPPLWEQGGSLYFERFESTMKGHVPNQAIERYFWAQSLWDDTMAWRAYLTHSPTEILTIVVGQFHAEFGHGLPARLQRQGLQNVRTLIQVAVDTWNESSLQDAIRPDSKYGNRADLIWVYKR